MRKLTWVSCGPMPFWLCDRILSTKLERYRQLFNVTNNDYRFNARRLSRLEIIDVILFRSMAWNEILFHSGFSRCCFFSRSFVFILSQSLNQRAQASLTTRATCCLANLLKWLKSALGKCRLSTTGHSKMVSPTFFVRMAKIPKFISNKETPPRFKKARLVLANINLALYLTCTKNAQLKFTRRAIVCNLGTTMRDNMWNAIYASFMFTITYGYS